MNTIHGLGGARLIPRRNACAECRIRALCLPFDLEPAELAELDRIVIRFAVKRGSHVYRAGSRFHSVFSIQRGFVKTALVRSDGREQVTGFLMPGEFVGVDGINSGSYVCDAVALEDSELCAMPLDRLEQLGRERPALQRLCHCIMSREVVRNYETMLLLGNMRAEERVAAFLLNLSQRLAARGFSPTEFNLRMSRGDIGSYLGLKVETVSRTFSRLRDEGLLSARKKNIRLIDLETMRDRLGEQPALAPRPGSGAIRPLPETPPLGIPPRPVATPAARPIPTHATASYSLQPREG
jgi:CRP/FNR family transcriptional regulator